MSNLTNNTVELQSILAAVNALPDSTGGGTGRDGVGIRQITLKSQTESGNTYTVHLTARPTTLQPPLVRRAFRVRMVRLRM